MSKLLLQPSGLITDRAAWIDIAKGISILLVVAMHSTLSVGEELGSKGFMHEVVAVTKPFRMPDFFFISGLLAASTLTREWRWFVDRKIIHFAYFYLLWLTILLVAKAPALGLTDPSRFLLAYLGALVEPFATLWFIFVLPLFFLFARCTLRLPAWFVLIVAAALHGLAAFWPEGGVYAMASRLTGWFAIDSFALFLVYFVLGARFSAQWLSLLGWLNERKAYLAAALGGWLVCHVIGLRLGWTEIPGATLLFGLAGAVAVTALSLAVAQIGVLGWLAAIGKQSLPIYVAFLIPMAISRHALVGYAGFSNPGWVAFAVFVISVLTCLFLARMAPRVGLAFLFKRPDWARLSSSA